MKIVYYTKGPASGPLFRYDGTGRLIEFFRYRSTAGASSWGGGVHQGYGGRVKPDVVLLTRELAGVIEWRPEDLVITVGSGTLVRDLEALVRERTTGRMADIVYEATGNSQLIPQEFAALRVEGRLVLVSSPGGGTQFNFQELCGTNSYTIIGAHNRSHTPVATWDNPWTQKHDSEFFFELQMNGDIDVQPLITHREPFTRAVEMYGMLMADRSKAVGVLLDWR